ncbi:MAG: hypothetical protein COA70_09670 [Planctomycetota bacterium]|nr:MAG: hypothetical protein COA70_09670 [Planctomycetota bacterium]
MRRILSLLAISLGLAALSTSCTMPDLGTSRSTKTSYPKIVETQQGSSMLGGDEEGSAWGNATRGTKYGD